MKTVKDFFKEVKDKPSVTDAYVLYLKGIEQTGGEYPEVYLSGALTSGGFRRDEKLSWDEGFIKNAELSAQIRKALYVYNLLDKNKLIFFPGDTATFNGWHQFEFNLFFGLTIINITNIEDVNNLVETAKKVVDMYGFVNDRATRDDRIHSYKSLLDFFENYIKENDIEIQPVKEIIQILDNDMSLGAWYEVELAKYFRARVLRVKVNTKYNSNDSLISDIISKVDSLKVLDVDFFDGNSEQSKPIYLVEI